jgi:ComF family protein
MPYSWQRSIERLRQQALDLFLKANCPMCERTVERVLCRYCLRQLQDCQLSQPACYWQGDLPLFAWGKYEGAVKQSIAKLKYDGHVAIADLYGDLLAQSWQQSTLTLPNKLVIVPIPLHSAKLASRGFNQAEAIARRFCQVTGDRLDLSLQRTRATVAQFGLSKTARQENVADAFALTASSILKPGSTVLLVDDIYTTGSTVRSAAEVFRSKQIDVCGVAVVATGRDR